MTDRTPVIAGVGLSDLPVAPGMSAPDHHALATRRALQDCGIDKADIDGYMTAGGYDEAVTMAEYLGIEPRFIGGAMTGGSSFELFAEQAMLAIEAGHVDAVLVSYGSNMLSARGRSLGTGGLGTSEGASGGGEKGAERAGVKGSEPNGTERDEQTPVNDAEPTAAKEAEQAPAEKASRKPKLVGGPARFEAPFGNTLVGSYAMAAMRHMHEFGTTPEQLAEIAVAIRGHAALNPHAMYRDPISVEDVLSSRMIADPLHLLDCCVVSDGGGALVITTAERAADLAQPPVYLLGAASAMTHWNVSQMPDFTITGASRCGPEAFARAGARPDDIDVLQLYDSFTITVLLLLEDLGFCKKGEGGYFVEGGRLRLGGSLPTNTDGGGLSACHPGMRGIFLLAEAARQLRGQAGEAQVRDCRLALACGSGGWLSCMGAVVMGNEHP
jgi:acetyl-CoA acetyltransferase